MRVCVLSRACARALTRVRVCLAAPPPPSQSAPGAPPSAALCRYVTVSMTVGPASGVLKGADPASWRAKDVALTVLIDRCGFAATTTATAAAWRAFAAPLAPARGRAPLARHALGPRGARQAALSAPPERPRAPVAPPPCNTPPLRARRRSTARLSTGQRTALNDVEESHIEDRGGQRFWVYEHRSQVGAVCGQGEACRV